MSKSLHRASMFKIHYRWVMSFSRPALKNDRSIPRRLVIVRPIEIVLHVLRTAKNMTQDKSFDPVLTGQVSASYFTVLDVLLTIIILVLHLSYTIAGKHAPCDMLSCFVIYSERRPHFYPLFAYALPYLV